MLLPPLKRGEDFPEEIRGIKHLSYFTFGKPFCACYAENPSWVGAARKYTQQHTRHCLSYTDLAYACLLAAYSVALVKIAPVF